MLTNQRHLFDVSDDVAYLNSAFFVGGLHAGGYVDRVAPDVVEELLRPDDTCNDGPGSHADA